MSRDNFESLAECLIRDPKDTCKHAYSVYTYEYIEGDKTEEFDRLSEKVGEVLEGERSKLVFCVLLNCMENIIIDLAQRGKVDSMLSIFAALRYWVNELFLKCVPEDFWEIKERLVKEEMTEFIFKSTGQNN